LTIWRVLLLSLALRSSAISQPTPTEFFEARIRPTLANKCYACHTASKLGGLRLDSREAMIVGGKSGPAIVPGQPVDSLLIRAVTHSEERLKMPMAGDRLSEREIADLRKWIEEGAPWPAAATVSKQSAGHAGFAITPEQRSFWSFQPLRKSSLPSVKNEGWGKSPVDRFILAKLEEKGLRPVKPADKRVLLRRASYDLLGLPPTPEQVGDFLADTSPQAFAKVVDRLLASPHYGERWGRHWLDVARYADGGGRDRRPVFLGYGMARDGLVNTWRYRDWVIGALNRDLPYDLFVKAQIAADLLPGAQPDLLPGLGFFGIGPWFTGDDQVFVETRANERDDKVDALTKGFLGLTVTCARCHDHKYDPISQKDYTSLAGVFGSSGYHEYSLAAEAEVAKYKAHWKKIKDQQAALEAFVRDCAMDVAERLAAQASKYLMAARKVSIGNPKPDPAQVAKEELLDGETFARWVKYLSEPNGRQHSYLKEWDGLLAKRGGSEEEARAFADGFQRLLLTVIADKKAILKANEEMTKTYLPDPQEAQVLLPGDLKQFEFFQYKQLLVQKVIETQKHYVWLDVVQGEPGSPDYPRKEAIFEYPAKQLVRFFTEEQKTSLESMRIELAKLEKVSPPEYPYLMGLSDNAQPANLKLHLRGDPHALGDPVPRGMPAILANTAGEPAPFTKGSGRLELAESIMRHPLAARVIVNRVWLHHFGRGIVASPSNFGVMGERPSHPELLDFLALRLIDNNWSLKALHREIMLTATYQLSYRDAEANTAADPDNRLLWRANLRRLDVEALRDSLLSAGGVLDERVGGPAVSLSGPENKRRTVYARIARGAPDRMLQLFDFPDPTVSGDQRTTTNVPLQGLFFLNSDLLWRQAQRLVERLGPPDAEGDSARINRAYQLLFGREATASEVDQGLRFLNEAGSDAGAKATPWQQYAQVLLSSGEFLYVN